VPMTSKSGKPKKSELPSTVRRSGKKARRTFARAHDAAADQYGEGERAHRTAYSALKRTHEKVGDHWEKKKGKGPSDAKAAGGRKSRAKTQGGVDANASKEHLMEVARRLKVPGRSTMNKGELVAGIRKANAQATRKSRS
jgi:cation transport regulator ChaB